MEEGKNGAVGAAAYQFEGCVDDILCVVVIEVVILPKTLMVPEGRREIGSGYDAQGLISLID
jgi:hypothetical protein